MTENFLLEDPLKLFDDFKDMPDEAFKFSGDEVCSIIDSVIESEDYIKILVRFFEKNPKDIKEKINDFEKELTKAMDGTYKEEKAKIVKYFMEKTLSTLHQIEKYCGAFKEIPVKVVKLDPEAKLPFYSDEGDACMDICSNIATVIPPHSTELIPTGIKVIVPGGYELQIRPRSGLSKKTGIRIPNTPGTIDSGFRKELCVLLENTSDTAFSVEKYDRIAQLKISEVPHIVWNEISEEEYQLFNTDRGEGFGSSGVATK